MMKTKPCKCFLTGCRECYERHHEQPSNAEINRRFLLGLSKRLRKSILGNIAKHYGVTPLEIETEVCEDPAEHLLDYVTVDRPVVHLMMKARGYSQ